MTAVKGRASESVNVYVYRLIFSAYRAGYGQAIAIAWLIFIFIITNFVARMLRRREVEL
jgi:raffinose/stachyose/melibiose transport system permease protein